MPTWLMRAGGNEAPPDFDLSLLHQTHQCAQWTAHAHTQKHAGKHLAHVVRRTPGLCPETVPFRWVALTLWDGVWILGSPLVASSITVFQRPAIHWIVHLSCSFSLLCICSFTPLSVKSAVGFCLRQELDGFELLLWIFPAWYPPVKSGTQNTFTI